MTNREASDETAEHSSGEHVAPVMMVVADARQADVQRHVDRVDLHQMTNQPAAGPRQTRLQVQLHCTNHFIVTIISAIIIVIIIIIIITG